MNDTLPSFEEFLATTSVQVPLWGFVLNLALTALVAGLLSTFYIRFGRSLSNRKQFAANFVLLAMTTMLIISIVKSSLALSLGLVGALSIVRFRAAIKEPEELAYLFLVIAIGLGFGANQRMVTLVAFGLMMLVLFGLHLARGRQEAPNLFLTVRTNGSGKIPLSTIVEALRPHATSLELKRLDEDQEHIDAAFIVQFKSLSAVEASKAEQRRINESVHVALLDQSGLVG